MPKTAKSNTEGKSKTLVDKITEINTNKFQSDKEKTLIAQNTKLKKQIASAKSKRGPLESGRISGLAKLKPNMGKQFTKPGDISSYFD